MGTIAMKRICRRCGGNVFPARDEEGTYLSCLQCGAVFYLAAPRRPAAVRPPATRPTNIAPR